MVMKIKKNRHYGSPFPWPKFFYKKENWEREVIVKFDGTIRYDIGEDQMGVNKLFGISYGLHHIDSDRIGFRYMPNNDMVEIVLYSYENGNRIKTKHLAYANICTEMKIKLAVSYNKLLKWRYVYVYIDDILAINETYVCSNKFVNIWYTLGLYFGGNKRAPHEIKIEMIDQ